MYETHSQIINIWNSVADFARDIDVPYQRARKMNDRGSIHSDYWSRVVNAAGDLGHEEITIDLLSKTKRKRGLSVMEAAQ